MAKDKPVQEKAIDAITSREHETIEDAITSQIKDHPPVTEEFYFMSFDMNSDFNGKGFERLFKKRITYRNELELQGQIGATIDKEAGEEGLMVMFLNKDRAELLHNKFRQFEGIIDGVLESTVKEEIGDTWFMIEDGEEKDGEVFVNGHFLKEIVDGGSKVNLTLESSEGMKFPSRDGARIYMIDNRINPNEFVITEHQSV